MVRLGLVRHAPVRVMQGRVYGRTEVSADDQADQDAAVRLTRDPAYQAVAVLLRVMLGLDATSAARWPSTSSQGPLGSRGHVAEGVTTSWRGRACVVGKGWTRLP